MNRLCRAYRIILGIIGRVESSWVEARREQRANQRIHIQSYHNSNQSNYQPYHQFNTSYEYQEYTLISYLMYAHRTAPPHGSGWDSISISIRLDTRQTELNLTQFDSINSRSIALRPGTLKEDQSLIIVSTICIARVSSSSLNSFFLIIFEDVGPTQTDECDQSNHIWHIRQTSQTIWGVHQTIQRISTYNHLSQSLSSFCFSYLQAKH